MVELYKGKVALIFPGLGTQYSGMGQDLYKAFPEARRVFDEARDVLWFSTREGKLNSLANLLGRSRKLDDRKKLIKTRDAQRAVFITNQALFESFKVAYKTEAGRDFRYDVTAGHSIGEYSAVVASGALSYKDALELVLKGTEVLHQSNLEMMANGNEGTLYIVAGKAGLGADKILEDNGVYIALSNTPEHRVIGGKTSDLERVAKELRKYGFKVRELGIEGPYHTKHMKKAADEIKPLIYSVPMGFVSQAPLISNCSVRFMIDPIDIRDELYYQLYQEVKWEQLIRRLKEYGKNGVSTFVIIGADIKDSLRVGIDYILKSARLGKDEKKQYSIISVKNGVSLKEAVNVLKDVSVQ